MVNPLTPEEILTALKTWSIPYKEQPGWQTRSNKTGWGDVTGFMWHHTGDDAPDSADLKVVTEGRSGLPGPLCNFGLADDGTVYLVAAGAANHAGGGDVRVVDAVRKESYTDSPPAPRFTHQDLLNGVAGTISCNPLFYGVECFYYAKNTPAQRQMMPKLAAAIIWALDKKDTVNAWSAKSAIGHKESQRGKIDPNLFGQSMATLREETQQYLNSGPEGDDMFDTTDRDMLRWIKNRIDAQLPQFFYSVDANGIAIAVDEGKGKPSRALNTFDGNYLDRNDKAIMVKLDALITAMNAAAGSGVSTVDMSQIKAIVDESVNEGLKNLRITTDPTP